MHTINVIARTVFSLLWIVLYVHMGGKETAEAVAVHTMLNCFILADFVTWIASIPFFIDVNARNIWIGGIVNLAVIVVGIANIRSLLPPTPEWQAMTVMVFLVTIGAKLLYYVLLKTHQRLSDDAACPPPVDHDLHT